MNPAIEQQNPFITYLESLVKGGERGALAALRIEDPAQRELLLHEGLRQLRMLSPQERLRTLDLLEAQLPKANQ